MQIQSNFPLRHYNTFGLESTARFFVEINSLTELTEILTNPEWKKVPRFILGGGSNILFTQDIDALVIHPKIKGIEKKQETWDRISLHVGAGENWHEFVMYCVQNGYGGVENLSLIPGSVGAAPMQNIGAYGVEVKNVIESVEAMEIETGELHYFSNADCNFGYRESIFKKEARNRFVITGVTFVLSKKPKLNIGYGDVQRILADMEVSLPTIKDVSEAIMQIRRSKLPDPAQIGNAGSFFKNPEIPLSKFNEIKDKNPLIPGYPVDENMMKVPAGWLIEQAGWKGYRKGNVGVHDRQALVLVNYGGGTGNEIKLLSETIQESVFAKFGISLKAEVNFI